MVDKKDIGLDLEPDDTDEGSGELDIRYNLEELPLIRISGQIINDYNYFTNLILRDGSRYLSDKESNKDWFYPVPGVCTELGITDKTDPDEFIASLGDELRRRYTGRIEMIDARAAGLIYKQNGEQPKEGLYVAAWIDRNK